MSDTILRHIEMLTLIPAQPVKVTARELHAKLEERGFTVDVRSIERDLHKLSGKFPLDADSGRPAGWCWRDRTEAIRFPRMDSKTALTFELLARYLAPLLPRPMLAAMEPEFATARSVLKGTLAGPLSRWSRRIAVLPFGHQLLPPDVDPTVIDGVYQALLDDHRFEADYQSASASAPSRYVVNPLGLVYRNGVFYLVATLWDYPDIKQLALQRMSNIAALDAPAAKPKGFDFERYVRDEKAFDYPLGNDIKLILHVDAWLARHLEESRLATDQKITPIRDSEGFRITASVADTDQLYWWLRSLGSSVKVIKPVALRRKMAEQARQLADIYADG